MKPNWSFKWKVWPLTPKIDRATWGFLKFNVRHRVKSHATGAKSYIVIRHNLFLNSTCDILENSRQGYATLSFYKTVRRHWGPPLRAPKVITCLTNQHPDPLFINTPGAQAYLSATCGLHILTPSACYLELLVMYTLAKLAGNIWPNPYLFGLSVIVQVPHRLCQRIHV